MIKVMVVGLELLLIYQWVLHHIPELFPWDPPPIQVKLDPSCVNLIMI